MRVLLWSSTFWPHIGGVEVLGAHFVRALSARGHTVVVLARRDTEDLPAEDEIAGTRVLRLRFRQAISARDPAAVAGLRSEVGELKRSFDPHVIHLYHLGPDLLLHRLTADVRPAPELVTLHQAYTGELLAEDVALGRTLRGAARIAACSSAVLGDLRARIPEVAARSELVRNALPSVPTEPLGEPEGPPTVLFVGRVVPQKGFDLGLRALARLLPERPQARAVIAGDGVSRPGLERLAAELGIADSVEFTGWVDPPAVRALMRAARCVVMPSRFEPFGLVALEAAQLGRAVVAFAVDGLPEVVEDGCSGVLVEPGDVPALAAAIARMLDEPALAAGLGAQGRNSARSGAAWDAHVSAYERIYRELAADV